MEQILLAVVFQKKLLTAIMMFNKDTNAMVRFLDGDTDYFGLVSLFNGISTFVDYLMPKPTF